MSNIKVVMDNGYTYSGNYVSMNEDWIFLTDVVILKSPEMVTEETQNIQSISLPKSKVSNVVFEDKNMIDEFMEKDISFDPRFMRRRRLRG